MFLAFLKGLQCFLAVLHEHIWNLVILHFMHLEKRLLYLINMSFCSTCIIALVPWPSSLCKLWRTEHLNLPQNFISLFGSNEEHHILTHFTAAVLFKIPFLVLYNPLTSHTPLKLWLDNKDATCTLQETLCTAAQRNHCRHLTHIAIKMISKCVEHWKQFGMCE